MNIFLSIGNREILSPWPSGWSLRAIKLIMHNGEVQNSLSTLGLQSTEIKNCNNLILERPPKEVYDWILKKHDKYFGLAIMPYPYWVIMRNEFKMSLERAERVVGGY